MTRHKITFLPSGKTAEVEDGQTLLQAAEQASLSIRSDCGGDGTCGKCRLRVISGEADSLPTPLLPPREGKKGWVLACLSRPRSDVTVEIPREAIRDKKHREETSRRFRDWEEETIPAAELDPLAASLTLSLPAPTLSDNLGDRERLVRAVRKATRAKNVTIPLDLLRSLPSRLRENSWEAAAVVAHTVTGLRVLDIRPKSDAGKAFGAAIDIGTTTVVVHLVDLATGKTVAAEAEYNSQIAFGDDVIKRIIRSEEDGVEKLAAAVRGDLNRLIERGAKAAGIETKEIVAAIAAGNTTMISLFCGLDPRWIRREPYIPPATDIPPFPARKIGLLIAENALLYLVPGVASWVGGDITAGVLHSGLYRSEDLALLVDIGTNGEIAVGNREWLLSCSCSAGPAFEGSGIACGMRAGPGAIDRFDLADDGVPSFRTIQKVKPTGICGSGLLDLASELFRTGLLGREGRLNASVGAGRIREGEAGPEYLVSEAAKNGTERDIVVTQADIDNLIRAKAAIYAGISVLLKAVNLSLPDVKRLYISGGFGNYLNIRHAICLGLLPDLPPEKITFIGNGSVRGAKRILLSRAAADGARRIARMMTYFELSADGHFMDEFSAAMFIPHTNVELFPSCRKACNVERLNP
jgi:uncharacterized 2Fe-2S/4Fe-4S cluster protein (DUF4445 family)